MKISLKTSGADQLKKIAAKIKKYPAQAAFAAKQAADDVAETVITRASLDITQRYNLENSYVREKFRLLKANLLNGEAVVGARIRHTRLARYGAEQAIAAAPRAKGDTLRGIAAGQKQAGVSVHVVRSNGRKTIKEAFRIPLRAGKLNGGNGMGIFERDGEKIHHLYGPSVHQAFQWWIKEKSPNVSSLIAKAFAHRMAQQLRKNR